jgi:flagellin
LENLKISDLNSQTKESSQEMLGHIDLAINYVNGNRAELGALQNRIQASINNLGVSKENLAQSNSMIRDANIALEAANMSQSRVMSKASTAVLTQANKEPEQAIKLL